MQEEAQVNIRKAVMAVALFVAIGLLLGAMVDEAYAQGDKGMAERRGLDVLGGTKKKDDKEGPKTWQIAVGVGSIFVMFAVVKWL